MTNGLDRKVFVVLKGGTPSSETFTTKTFVVSAWLTNGRHVRTPLVALSNELVGELFNKLNASACAGISRSAATLVMISVMPALIVLSPTGMRVGAVFTTACPTNVTTLNTGRL